MDAIKRYKFLGALASVVDRACNQHFMDVIVESAVEEIDGFAEHGIIELGTEYNQMIEAISDIKLAKKYKEGWS